jgi:beta-glucosidase
MFMPAFSGRQQERNDHQHKPTTLTATDMKNPFSKILATMALLVAGNYLQAQTDAGIETKINALLKQMSLEEKVGQMAQVSIESLGGWKDGKFQFSDKLQDAIVNYKIGSILNTPGLQSAAEWNRIIGEMQAKAKQTKQQIPILYGLDNVHGVSYVAGATLFPQQIGMGASFDRKLVQEAAVITAYESRAAGVPWTFSPVLDLGTNPVWPRIWEGFGEDPYLIAELGKAAVIGYQDPLTSKQKIAVSLKHYMAYSDPKSGKDRSDAWIPEHYLREYHLPPFTAAVKAGARTVMVNSALINGIPTHVNKHILTDMLKKEMGFTGFIVSDWQDIENVYRRDKITANIKEAIALSINAGIDMSMIPYDYKQFCTDLIALVKENKVSQARIDDAVRRILRIKYELDLFNTPLTSLSDYPKFGSAEFEKAAHHAAGATITLLKNKNDVLPLPANAKVLVTGPNANSMRTLNGGWTYSWQGERTDQVATKYNTILEAIGKKFTATYEPGVVYKPNRHFEEDSIVSIDAVVKAAANVDYVLLCIGENSYTETPGNINDLNLSDNQSALAQALAATGKPVIMVLNEGRPRIIRKIEPVAAAILDIFLPGNYGGDALADVLAGVINPSGKMPYTYPRYPNALAGYIHKPSEGNTNPQGGDFNPQFPFGFGLSYTKFSYSGLTVDKKTLQPDESVTVNVTVTNSGNRAGSEVVQLYVSDILASFTPDVKRLRGFEKIELAPGASKTISFTLAVKELAFVNPDNKKQLEPGDFRIQVANQSATISLAKGLVF